MQLTATAPCSLSWQQVAKVVAPKKAKLEEMNSLLAAANATLATKQARCGCFTLFAFSHYSFMVFSFVYVFLLTPILFQSVVCKAKLIPDMV